MKVILIKLNNLLRKNECIANAHKAQTNLLAQEAQGDDIAFSITMIHGQDHLMTTLLLKDLMKI